MKLINESEFEHAEAVNSAVAGICLGLFIFMAGLPFVFGGGWLIALIGG